MRWFCGYLQNYQLLNCDDHANFLRKHKRDPAQYRPDITHQVYLTDGICVFELSVPAVWFCYSNYGVCVTRSFVGARVCFVW